MDVMTLLQDYAENKDAMLEQLAHSNMDIQYLIADHRTSRKLCSYSDKGCLFGDKYYLIALFDLKQPFPSANMDFFLYVFSKEPSEQICYGIFPNGIHCEHYGRPLSRSASNLDLYPLFSADFLEYISFIDHYLVSGTLPYNTNGYEFSTFPATLLNVHFLRPQYYCRHVREARQLLSTCCTVPLGKIVQIMYPRPEYDERSAFVVKSTDWQYPMSYTSLCRRPKTNCLLQKGDILFFSAKNIQLLYEEPPQELYASPNCYVIRLLSADFCPEYLYYYLISNNAQALLASMQDGIIPRIDGQSLSKFPIAMQDQDHAFYRTKFFEENYPYSYLKEHPGLISGKNTMLEPYSGEKEYIFISYAHKDKHIVLPIIQYLYTEGYRVWYDEGIDPGTEWDKNIAEHVEGCGYFIAMMSRNYLASSNCKDELSYARDLEKNRFLIYIEEVGLPSEMKMRLTRIQNIHKNSYSSDEDFYKKLVSAKDFEQFKD